MRGQGQVLPTGHAFRSMVNATSASSAAGVIALLHDDDPELQAFALEELNSSVDVFWSEVADHASRL